MLKTIVKAAGFLTILITILIINNTAFAQSTLDCSLCHPNQHAIWMTSRHADTQNDVADELAGEWAGSTPDDVINGPDAENCLACHSPAAVAANGGMTEVQTLEHFFSTTGGLFTASTHPLDEANWPSITCVSCHDVPSDHPVTMPTLSIFNSPTSAYVNVDNASMLCGQCHGTLRYDGTDHRRYDAWLMSRHGHGGQADVAAELAEEWAGSSPDDVINGADAEDCIACHAATSVLMNGGITEAEALDNFFTTTGGVFTDATAPQDSAHWTDVSCTTCHNPMHPDSLAYFNSATAEYQYMSSSQELCGQCHGNLRFPDTDHLSYNIATGTGGIGVADTLTMPGIECVDCHMHSEEVEDTNLLMFAGHSWSVFIHEEDGSTSASCTSCHASIGANLAEIIVETWQSEFADLDSIAQAKVAEADAFLSGSSDSTKIHMLEDAMHNLEFAESDESGGVHNHNYTMALLNDAVSKSNFIITGINEPPLVIAHEFELQQNYPNPFNSTTTIAFSIPKAGRYVMNIYDVNGKMVRTIVNKNFTAQTYSIRLDANSLASGIYFYRLIGNGMTMTKKFILMK